MQTFLKYINGILHQLLGEELDAKIKHYFLSGAYKSIFLQGAIALLTFFTGLFIARVTGDEGFGIYTTVFTWVSIVSVGATLGLDDLALKQLPIYKEKNELAKVKGLLSWANAFGGGFGVFCAIVLLIIANCTNIHGLSEYADYYFWAVWVIPLFVLMHVNQAALRGLHFFGWGQFAEKFVQPLSLFLFLVGIYCLQRFQLTDEHAIFARVLSFVVTAIAAVYLLLKYTKKYRGAVASYEIGLWWKSCRYFAITSLLYIINTRIDIVFLGLYQVPQAEIAYYNAALKLSDMALIPFAVLYTVTAPMFSTLYASKDMEALQLFFTKTTRLACFIITLILLVLVIGGEWFLALFGDSFRAGYPVLLILCIAKFVHVFVGPVNYLLMMVNLEKEATWGLLLSVILTIGLHLLWIPLYGIIGAGYATLVGLLLFEFLMGWLSYRAGIIPTVLGRFLRTKNKSSK
ncbi:flippase [Aureispira anguillae]|uniref:Flippase n=1 Tax=Aureispira anguillae TaxID=2864201 RepID=A0A916DW16_9BACT|nr:flippase [Aureispira anguillae]BDS14185.1 flippase [Aureispira anguillae]